VSLEINKNSKWGKSSRLKRRINGFIAYIMCAFLSLYAPEAVDMALYKELKEQFQQ